MNNFFLIFFNIFIKNSKTKKLIIIVFNFVLFNSALINNADAAISLVKFQENFSANCEYTICLQNGDILSGKIIEFIEDSEDTNLLIAIKLASLVGNVKIYEDEIQKIAPTKTLYSNNHRAFIMPTANPINNNFFVGSYELFVLYAGLGISDWISISGGGTIIPKLDTQNSIYYSDNASVLNAKISLPKLSFPDSTSVVFAVGTNLTFLANHNLFHIYGLATYNTQDASQVTAGLFYKAGNQELPMEFSFLGSDFLIDYPDGAIGIIANAEVKFKGRKDLSFIGEFWNSDITRPTNSVILLGLRLKGRNFSSDLGLLLSTHPFAAPVINFIWTFN